MQRPWCKCYNIPMKKTLRERLDLHKVSRYAIAANAAQVFFAVGLVLYALLGREFNLSGMAERLLICAAAHQNEGHVRRFLRGGKGFQEEE